MKNALPIVLGITAGISTGFAIFFGIKNYQYVEDWKGILARNPQLDLSLVKYLPKP